VRGVLVEHDAILSRAIKRYGGRRVKHTGDGIFATFPTVPEALLAATDVAADFERNRERATDAPLAVRIAITAGDVLSSGHDLFGTVVTAAHRVCALAKDNQILVAANVVQAVKGHGFAFEDRGAHELKGFPEPVQLWELSLEQPTTTAV
jgi:adenylate cyclase